MRNRLSAEERSSSATLRLRAARIAGGVGRAMNVGRKVRGRPGAGKREIPRFYSPTPKSRLTPGRIANHANPKLRFRAGGDGAGGVRHGAKGEPACAGRG